MARSGSIYWSLVTIALIFISTTSTLTQDYCSPLNTGSDISPLVAQFQSNGLCRAHCVNQYAFAIVQGSSCWCSNFGPGETTALSSCNEQCPGYTELCGNTAAGLFGYLVLSISPSGTVGGSTSTPQPPSSTAQTVSDQPSLGNPSQTQISLSVSIPHSTVFVPLPSSLIGVPSPVTSTIFSSASDFLTHTLQTSVALPDTVTVLHTVTEPASVQTSASASSIVGIFPSSPSTAPTTSQTPVVVPPPATSSAPSTLQDSTTIIPSSATWTATPFASVITVTGDIQTVTVTPTAPPAPAQTSQVAIITSNPSGFFSNTGKVVATFVMIGVIVLAATALFMFYRRRQFLKHQERLIASSHTAEDNNPQRRSSRLSQLGFAVRRSNGDWDLPPLATNNLQGGSGSEKSPGDTITPMSRRESSYPRMVDQRLDPAALWSQENANGSHVSLSSFRDDRDYSRRMLRVANPDSDE